MPMAVRWAPASRSMLQHSWGVEMRPRQGVRHVSHKVLLMQVHHRCPLLDSRVLLHSQDQVPEHFPPVKLQTSPDLFVNMVVKSFGEKNEEFGRTFVVVRAFYFSRTHLNRMNLNSATAGSSELHCSVTDDISPLALPKKNSTKSKLCLMLLH